MNTHSNVKIFGFPSIYVLLFAILLTAPSLYCFQRLIPEFSTILDEHKTIVDRKEELVFKWSKRKLLEIIPWLVVAITAVLVMSGNTFIYFISFLKEKKKSAWFWITFGFFLLWLFVSVWYLVKTVWDISELKNEVSILTNQFKTTFNATYDYDGTLRTKLTDFLDNFVHRLEYFILITVGIFIVIDGLTLRMKANEIKESKSKQKLLVSYERSFICSQLLFIDISVLGGVILIHFFTEELQNTDAKSVFIIGGIAMHIIMSQIIFLLLAFQNAIREYRFYNK